MEICVAWRNGCIDFKARNNELEIITGDLKIILRPRAIIFINGVTDYELGESGRKAKKKYIYIYPRNGIEPINKCGKLLKEYTLDRFEIMYQKLSFNEYMTIITPGEYLYDYIILTNDTVTIAMSGKKEAYFYREEDKLTIYIV